jgi:hypothetical protein
MSSSTVVITVQVVNDGSTPCHVRSDFLHADRMTCSTCTTHPAWFDAQFQRLLEAWNRHQDLHEEGADITELFESRRVLDDMRTTCAHTERAHLAFAR